MSNGIWEKEIEIDGKYKLRGTLTFPNSIQEKLPALLFVHGSGKLDRDGSTAHISMKVFKELSDEISKLGIATLRYDKRGCGKSEGVFDSAGFWDFVEDAECAIGFLKNHAGIDSERIILLGHSEGCAVVTAVNRKIPVSAIILLAGFLGSLLDNTKTQIDRIIYDIEEMKGIKGILFKLLLSAVRIKKQNDKLNKRIKNSTEPVIRIWGKKIYAKWIREHMSFHVNDFLKEIKCPVLAVVGTKDMQVVSEHTKMMGNIIQAPFEYHILEDMNHILRCQKEPVTMIHLFRLYKKQLKQGKPIDPRLIGIVKDWLARHTKMT